MSGAQLRYWAEQRKLSGKKIAEMRGIRPETVSRHMNERTEMSKFDIEEYAKILKVHPFQIYGPVPNIEIFGVVDGQSIVYPRDKGVQNLSVNSGLLGENNTAVLYPKDLNRRKRQDLTRLNADEMDLTGMLIVRKAPFPLPQVSSIPPSSLNLIQIRAGNTEKWVVGYIHLKTQGNVDDEHIAAADTQQVPGLLSVKEAAKILFGDDGITKQKRVRRLIVAGELNAIVGGKRKWISLAEIQRITGTGVINSHPEQLARRPQIVDVKPYRDKGGIQKNVEILAAVPVLMEVHNPEGLGWIIST